MTEQQRPTGGNSLHDVHSFTPANATAEGAGPFVGTAAGSRSRPATRSGPQQTARPESLIARVAQPWLRAPCVELALEQRCVAWKELTS